MDNGRKVGVVDRFGDQNLVVRIEHGSQRGVQAKGGTTGDEDFFTGGVFGATVPQDCSGDSFPQSMFSPVVRVSGASLGECLLSRGDDVLGGREVRCTSHQRYRRLPVGLKVPDLLENRVDGGGFEQFEAFCEWHMIALNEAMSVGNTGGAL